MLARSPQAKKQSSDCISPCSPPRDNGKVEARRSGCFELLANLMDLSTVLALLASAFLGTAVVIANVGLRYLDPARGALVSIPSTTLLYCILALFLFRGEGWNATAFTIFAAVGLIFPSRPAFLNFAANRPPRLT